MNPSQPTINTLESIAARFDEIADIFSQVSRSPFPRQIEEFANLLVKTFRAGNKLMVFGNGGSASDAQHLCGELVVRFQKNRQALPAIALCSDTAVLTACGNDFAFHQIFSRQISALGKPGDVALGISTSGDSPNVSAALKTAREMAIYSILLTGSKPGEAAAHSDIVLAAPAAVTARIQEIHLAAYHAICEIVESHFS